MNNMEDKKELKKLLRQGKNIIYVVQKGVSRSGMVRKLALYVMTKDGVHFINWMFCNITGWRMDKNGYVIAHGCGMDMHYHTVYTLSCALYGYKNEGGYKLKHHTL